MGDFERTFGAGANADSIIDHYSKAYSRMTRRDAGLQSRAKNFSSFQDAAAWAKRNPGRSIVRVPGTDEFMIKDPNHTPEKNWFAESIAAYEQENRALLGKKPEESKR